MEEVRNEQRRGCGYRKSGAYYLVGNKDFEESLRISKEYTNKFSISGDIILLKEFIQYSGKRFRGIKYADEISEINTIKIMENLLESATKELYVEK